MSKMLRRVALNSVGFSALLLGGCAVNGLPEAGGLPSLNETKASTAARFTEDAGPGVTRVRVPGSSMESVSIRQPVSASLRSRPIEVNFPAQTATMGDLVDSLTLSDVQIAYRFSDGGVGSLARVLPFTRFKGTLGGLLDALKTGMGLVTWQEGDLVFLSDSDRYAVTLPQNAEVLSDVAASISALGATQVVTSADGGKIIYAATPTAQAEVIGPFLKRIARNLSTINLQVAVVNLSMTDNSTQGFDWSSFSTLVDTREEAGSLAGGADPDNQFPGSILPDPKNGAAGNVFDLTGSSLFLGTTSIGEIFGTKAVASVTAAVGYLSTFGNASVSQNVEMKTLSGKPVQFRSGQEIPYVKGVEAVASEGAVTGSATTDKVQTGLTVNMLPRYDSDSNVLTIDVSMDLTEVIEFVDLSAGNQVGTITQPRTQTQTLNDIVQMRAGQTAVIGGLQYDREDYHGNEPTALRDTLKRNSMAIGKRSKDVTRQSLFVILRPTVTVYEPSDVAGALATK